MLDKNQLEYLIEKHYTQKALAEHFKCSQSTVRHWLKKYGLRTKKGRAGKYPKDYKIPRRCGHCGETNPDKFYGHKRSVCGKCHSKYTLELGHKKRDKALEMLGGRCKACGFNKYKCSLDIHHLDPNKKDVAFVNYRSWSWNRLKKELEGCILLCRNCHSAFHNGEDVFSPAT